MGLPHRSPACSLSAFHPCHPQRWPCSECIRMAGPEPSYLINGNYRKSTMRGFRKIHFTSLQATTAQGKQRVKQAGGQLPHSRENIPHCSCTHCDHCWGAHVWWVSDLDQQEPPQRIRALGTSVIEALVNFGQPFFSVKCTNTQQKSEKLHHGAVMLLLLPTPFHHQLDGS